MNLSTILVLCAVAAIFAAIVATTIRNKKRGKHTCSCGGNCQSCGMNGGCHH